MISRPPVRLCHQMLFNTDRIVEVFVVGTAGVGSALLEQIRRQQAWLKSRSIDLRVCGIANSKAMLTNMRGIDLQDWRQSLARAKEPFSLSRLIRTEKKNITSSTR